MTNKLDEEMKAEIFKLIRNLYIDREPYTISYRPNLVRVLDASRYLSKKKVLNQESHRSPNHQSSIEFSGEPIGGLLSGHILLPKKKRLFLYDEATLIGQEEDEGELKEFLHEFKEELLGYLLKKQE